MLHLYDNSFGNLRMGYASALAWLLFVVVLLVTLVQWRLNKLVYYEGAE
jgi:multiple sugar transport system permease protein